MTVVGRSVLGDDDCTRDEVFEWCKKKFSATTVTVQKKGNRWHCRYYGRY